MVRKMKKKKKRKRVSKDETKKRMGKQGGGGDWYTFPSGVVKWIPEKKGRYNLNVVPYEVTVSNHPEDIEKGLLWFRTSYRVHHSVGITGQSIICPLSVGKKCPICEEANRLRKEDEEANEELINELKPQLFVAMNILNPDDPDEISVFAFSYGKFDKYLRLELDEEENEEHLDFYHCDEGGRTLRTRFSEASFMGNKYLEATDISFKERDELDEDEILEKTVDLDKMLNVLSYDKIKSMFLEEQEVDADDEEIEEEEEKEPKAKPRKRKSESKKKKKTKKKEVEEEVEEEDEIPEGMVECIACEGTGKSSKGKKCVPCEGTGVVDEEEGIKEEIEEIEDDELEDEEWEDDWDDELDEEEDEEEEDEDDDEEEDELDEEEDWNEDEDEEEDWDEEWEDE